MKSKNIRIIVFLALLTLVLLVVNQYYWVRRGEKLQENLLKIQIDNQKQRDELFETEVMLSIVNVRDQLLLLNKESSGLYLEPVKQITENYFVASFYDTLNLDLLKNLLVEEFKTYNINEVFEYGVYDCFSDSIIFDKYVGLSLESNITSIPVQPPSEKWKHDGHYFGVYFPNKNKHVIKGKSISKALYWSSIVVLFIILIVGYAILVILKQKKLSEVKTDFFNNMTHELKTPIATIKLSAEVLSNPNVICDSTRINRYVSIIKTESQRLEKQVNKVLQVAKLGEDKIKLEIEEVDLHQLIRNAVEVFKVTIESNNGYVYCDLDAKSHFVNVDKVHITNIIYNLVDNAIKYSEKAPFISISTYNVKKGIEIEIKDSGIGINKEHLPHVFERFFRVPKGSVHNVKGFGIGLFYVKYVVEKHGGSIVVKSKVNKGTTFTIYLPFY